MVFMQHGLMVGMWMCSTGLIGLWLWLSAAARRVFGCPIGIAASVLVVTAILCKSFGAIALLFAGGVALLFVRHARSAIVVWGLVAMAPTYMVARAYFGWNPQAPVEWVESIGGEQRAGSWQVRLDTEDDFIRAAWQKPFFGWRHWGDSRAVWRNGRAVPDGLWTLTLVQMGFPALVALTALFLIPVILFVRRYPSNTWMSGAVAPAAALALVLALYLIDCLSNAMVNPLFTLAAGGLTSLVVTAPAGIESAQLRRKPSRAHSRRSGRTTKPVGAT
jgi:O-antigen ligase